MDRIANTFKNSNREDRSCFISYVCAGDPDFDTSVEICRLLAEGPVDLLEIGVPFSDPLADGLTNQLAAQRALENGMSQDRVFELARIVRSFTNKPIVFYTYYNLVHSRGIEEYLAKVRDAGVDGLLILDLPPEEAGELCDASARIGVKNIFIVAPTTPPERVKLISDSASGFIYYVSREGVTGERETIAGNIDKAVRVIKRVTDLPVVVGFGISTPEQVKAVAAVADGVVVGSALVNSIAEDLSDRDRVLENLSERLAYLTS